MKTMIACDSMSYVFRKTNVPFVEIIVYYFDLNSCPHTIGPEMTYFSYLKINFNDLTLIH